MRRNQYDWWRWKESSSGFNHAYWHLPSCCYSGCSYQCVLLWLPHPACGLISQSVIHRNYFADGSETGDLSRDDVSWGWINTTYTYTCLRKIYKLHEVWKAKENWTRSTSHLTLRRSTGSWRCLEYFQHRTLTKDVFYLHSST